MLWSEKKAGGPFPPGGSKSPRKRAKKTQRPSRTSKKEGMRGPKEKKKSRRSPESRKATDATRDGAALSILTTKRGRGHVRAKQGETIFRAEAERGGE